MVFVCQWDINHTHQRFPEESAIALTVILLENLASTLRAHRQNKSPTWFQLFQELLMHMFKSDHCRLYKQQLNQMHNVHTA